MKYIKTLKSKSEFKFKEKGSVFLGIAFPVEDGEAFYNILTSVKKEHYNATHHCYAFKTLNEVKYSDDGEPSGTAGIRLLNAIEHYKLLNSGVVVVRYYGGTKLGVGPLGKAYYQAANDVLDNSDIIIMSAFAKAEIIFNFSQSKTIYHIINNHGVKIKDTIYEDSTKLICNFPFEEKDKIKEKIDELRNGVDVKIFEGILFE